MVFRTLSVRSICRQAVPWWLAIPLAAAGPTVTARVRFLRAQ